MKKERYNLYQTVKHKVWRNKEKTYLVRIVGYCTNSTDVLVEFLNPKFVEEYNLHKAKLHHELTDTNYKRINPPKKEEDVYYYVPIHTIVGYATEPKRRKITIRLPKTIQHDRV
jgi:hypothetical protein